MIYVFKNYNGLENLSAYKYQYLKDYALISIDVKTLKFLVF